MGDHLFLYAPGGSKRIFAIAKVVGDPEPDIACNGERGSCRWQVGVQYLIKRPVASGIHIAEVSTGKRTLTYSIRRQSHIKLFPEA